MMESIINPADLNVNSAYFTDITTIKAFDEKGEWFIEVKFKSGVKIVTQATADEITQIENDLNDRGWQIDPSLFHRGFNAKPGNGLGRWWAVRADALAIAGDEPLGFDDEDNLIFASIADMFDDALVEAAL